MLTSIKQLLTAIVDYAGLFPPAQLDLVEALAEYNRALASPHAWMLSWFVLPAKQLPDLVALLSSLPDAQRRSHPLPLSLILSADWVTDLAQVEQCTATDPAHQIFVLKAVEVAPLPPTALPRVTQQLPADVRVFFEIPFTADLDPYLPVLQQLGVAAKLRTGGVTPAAFPDSTQLSQCILALAQAKVPFKATAGLHHPLRGIHRCSEQMNSDSTCMHGFLNVALLATLAYHQAIPRETAVALLEESAIAPLQLTETAIHWRDFTLPLSALEQARQHFFRSFGSCSWQDPVADLHHLGLL